MKNSFYLFLLLSLSSCSSLSDLRKMVWGGGNETSRKPASQETSNGSVLIHEGKFGGNYPASAGGPDLGRNEFGVSSGARKNPWSGTGPENEGSLWNGDTQDNFYFTQNTFFKVGDLIKVKMDSEINDSLNSRIASLLGDKAKSVRKVASEEAASAISNKVAEEVDGVVKNDRLSKAIGGELGSRVESALDLPETYVNIDEIPVRIVESLPNRVFSILGSKKIFIKNAPYQVVLSGSVRHEDILKDGSILSQNVLESRLELTK